MTNQDIDDYLDNLPGKFPAPSAWMAIYDLLPDGPNGERPPPPLVLGAMGASDTEKSERFREQLLWANSFMVLDRVQKYIDSMRAKDGVQNARGGSH